MLLLLVFYIKNIIGTQKFVKAAGRGNAMRYILTGDPMTSSEAKNMNLISVVIKDEN